MIKPTRPGFFWHTSKKSQSFLRNVSAGRICAVAAVRATVEGGRFTGFSPRKNTLQQGPVEASVLHEGRHMCFHPMTAVVGKEFLKQFGPLDLAFAVTKAEGLGLWPWLHSFVMDLRWKCQTSRSQDVWGLSTHVHMGFVMGVCGFCA